MYFTCSQCGIRKKEDRKGQIYCSMECYGKATIGLPPTRFKCGWCYEEFKPRRKDAIYCSNACRAYSNRSHKKDRIYIYRLNNFYKLRLIEKKDSMYLKGMVYREDADEIVKKHGVKWKEIDSGLAEVLSEII